MTGAGVSLLGRVAAAIQREQWRPAEWAHDAVQTLFRQIAPHVRTDLGAFLAQGRPEQEQDRRLAYWVEGEF